MQSWHSSQAQTARLFGVNGSINSASFFTLQRKTQQQGERVCAQRFFSSSGSDASDAEDGAEDARPQRGSRNSGFNNRNADQGGDDVQGLIARIEGGELDGMNEFQLMVYMQKMVRGFTTQRDVPIAVRGQAIDRMSDYLNERLARDESPIYLHEVGDFLSLLLNQNRAAAGRLRQTFRRVVTDAFAADEVRQEYRDMSLYRLAQILRAMPANRQSQRVLMRAEVLLATETEPKPIVAVHRILQHVTASPQIAGRTTSAQRALIRLLSDPNQVDLANVNVRTRAQILGGLAEISRAGNGQVAGECEGLMSKLLDSIKNDIGDLEERPVVELVNALTKIISLQTVGRVGAEAVELLSRVHSVVSDMAVENAGLVDTNFIMDYLNSISTIQKRRRLDQDKTDAFLDMFRRKCQEESTAEFVLDYLVNTQLVIDATRSYHLPELEQLLVRKWTEGKRAQAAFLTHFQDSKKILERDSPSEDQMAEFNEKSLDRIEDLTASLRRGRGGDAILTGLQLMAVLEQLPESERRNELIQQAIGEIDAVPALGPRGARGFLPRVASELLGKEAVIGDQTREVLYRVLDQIFVPVTEALESEDGGEEAAKAGPGVDAGSCLQYVNSLYYHGLQPGSDRELRDRMLAQIDGQLAKCELPTHQIESHLTSVVYSYNALLSEQETRHAQGYLSRALRHMCERYRGQPEDTRLSIRSLAFIDKIASTPVNTHHNTLSVACAMWLDRQTAPLAVPDTDGGLRQVMPRAQRLQTAFGRSFRLIDQQMTAILCSEEVATKFPVRYLKMAEEWGGRRLPSEAQDLLAEVAKRDDLDVASVFRARDTDAQKLVFAAKLNNLRERVAAGRREDSGLSAEELSDSHKKALLALQTKERRGIDSQWDQISQLLQVSKVGPAVFRENAPLVRETLDVIYDDIIPQDKLVRRVVNAIRMKEAQREGPLGRAAVSQVLLHTSNHLKTRLENFELPRHDFLDLLDMYASTNWQNFETYNGFIRGFGSNFDKFSEREGVRFVKALVGAGLNQIDILEAVIEKVLENQARLTQPMKCKMIIDLITTAIQADAVEGEAFQQLTSVDQLDKLLNGRSQRSIAGALRRNYNATEKVDLLNAIIARVDLTQDSGAKQFGNLVLDEVSHIMQDPRTSQRLGYKAKRDLSAMDYVINEHPNRDAILDSTWTLNLSDKVRESIRRVTPDGQNAKRGQSLTKALEAMGYENIDTSSSRYSATSQLYLPDQNTHVLMEQSPYMFDGTTLKPSLALAEKSIGALGGGARTVCVDQRRLGRRELSEVTNALNACGIATLEAKEASADSAAETSEQWEQESSPADAPQADENVTPQDNEEASK